jgi:hypothetical protein
MEIALEGDLTDEFSCENNFAFIHIRRTGDVWVYQTGEDRAPA